MKVLCVKRAFMVLASVSVLFGETGVSEVYAATGTSDGYVLQQKAPEIEVRKRIYPVKKGDYLKKIAAEVYGSSTCWEDIYEANKQLIGDNPDYILPDMYLVLPELPEKKIDWDGIYDRKERIEEMPVYNAQMSDKAGYRIEEHYFYKNEKDCVYGKWEEEEGRFDIVYPQIVFEDGRDAEAVNREIRDCAMFMANRLYLQPQGWLMEKCRTDELYSYEWRISEVTYQITYMDENLLSVVFYDDIFMGSIYGESYEMRGITIDLNTGHVYVGKDLFVNRSGLAEIVHGKIQGLYEEDEKHYQILEETMDEALFERLLESTEWLDGRYCGVMFLDKNGVNLGLSFRANSHGLIWRGYETVAFTAEELSEYQSDSVFWRLYLQDEME